MAKQKELRMGNKGYECNKGWKAVEYPTNGMWEVGCEVKVSQPRFYLGHDKNAAEVAALRLDQLWKQVQAEHETRRDVMEIDFGIEKLVSKPPRPIWEPLMLAMAQAIAKGATTFKVPRPYAKQWNLDYVKYLANLRRAFPVIQLVAEDDEGFAAGQSEVQANVERARAVAKMMEVVTGTGQTLHQAFDDYIAKLRSEERPGDSGWHRTQANQAQRLKLAHKDCLLSAIGLSEMQVMFDHWRFRPNAQRTGKPISVNTAGNQLWQLGSFFDWLHKEPRYDWRRPADCWLDINKTIKETTADKAQRYQTIQVPNYSVEELAILYRFASPLMRTMMLLGINCGFKQAELGTLATVEVFLKQAHPLAKMLGIPANPQDSFIKRVRIKSGVYGEWLLWPETVAAIEWALERRRLTNTERPFVLVTSKGRGYAEKTASGNKPSKVRNYWENLLDTIQAEPDHKDFRRLPFEALRDTASDMVRSISDGEVSGIFLCHGKPVKSDSLADIYTNRPFGKVFNALRKLRTKLQPMFADQSQAALA
jgi:hypothetical protein